MVATYSYPGRVIAFAGTRRIAEGSAAEVAAAVKQLTDAEPTATVLVFDAETSAPVEYDLRGTPADVVERVAGASERKPADAAADAEEAPSQRRGPGRPKLGVIAGEVTLLPRHWEWLKAQPGGASVTMRRLVEAARRDGEGAERVRAAQESAYRFMSVMAGNEAGFEEATRALYRDDSVSFRKLTEGWPADVRDHVRRLATPALTA